MLHASSRDIAPKFLVHMHTLELTSGTESSKILLTFFITQPENVKARCWCRITLSKSRRAGLYNCWWTSSFDQLLIYYYLSIYVSCRKHFVHRVYVTVAKILLLLMTFFVTASCPFSVDAYWSVNNSMNFPFEHIKRALSIFRTHLLLLASVR